VYVCVCGSVLCVFVFVCVRACAFVSCKNLPQSLPQGCLTLGFFFYNCYMELLEIYADVFFNQHFQARIRPNGCQKAAQSDRAGLTRLK
jgi:hypothetical protein